MITMNQRVFDPAHSFDTNGFFMNSFESVDNLDQGEAGVNVEVGNRLAEITFEVQNLQNNVVSDENEQDDEDEVLLAPPPPPPTEEPPKEVKISNNVQIFTSPIEKKTPQLSTSPLVSSSTMDDVSYILDSLISEVEEPSTSNIFRKVILPSSTPNQSNDFIVTPDVINNPDSFKIHISLRGTMSLAFQRDVFQIYSDPAIPDTHEIGVWEGKWGMNDSAFSSPHGVTSDFKYRVRKNWNELEDDLIGKPTKASVTLTGYFFIKAEDPKPNIKVNEKDVILSLSKPLHNAESEIATVFGSGKNDYGSFRLFGTYNSATHQLNCYREYVKSSGATKLKLKPKSTLKRKTFSERRKAGKRAKPGISPLVPSSLPAVSPVSFGQDEESQDLDDTRPERLKKTPSYLLDTTAVQGTYPSFSPITPGPPHSGASVSYSFDVDDDVESLKAVVYKVIQGDKDHWFTQPVNAEALGLTHYHDIVKRPMDLGTIWKKLEDKTYLDSTEVIQDVRLVFQNAMLFNPPGHAVHKSAQGHLKYFEKDLRKWETARKQLQRKKEAVQQAAFRKSLSGKQKKNKATSIPKTLPKKEVVPKQPKLPKPISLPKKNKTLSNGKTVKTSPDILSENKPKKKKGNKKFNKIFSSSDDDSDSESQAPSEKEEMNLSSIKKQLKQAQNPSGGNLALMQGMVEVLNQNIKLMQQLESQKGKETKNGKAKNRKRASTVSNEPKQKKKKAPKKQNTNPPQAVHIPQPTPVMQQQMSSSFYGPQHYAPPPPAINSMLQMQSQPVSSQYIPTQFPPNTLPLNVPKQRKKREEKELSYQERRLLGQDIHRLPPDAIPEMISLLHNEGADLGDGDEVELDMQQLPVPILRKLQKYVRKVLAKAKGQSSIADMHFDSD